MTKIAIFGVGLIGGSLALCYKGKPEFTVVGHSPNPNSVEKLLKRNVVDIATTSMAEAVDGADFIFLCVPVGMLEQYVQELMKLPLKAGCIITDVGSTKATITESAQSMVKEGVYFIGGHPMAGSERHGVEAASSHLFENAFYVLTPAEGTPQAEVDRLSELLKPTKAQIVQVGAREHDDIVGAISHLPHIIAVALVNQVRGYNESNPLYQNLAAGGFRDITRIASSEPTIWRDILVNNRDVLLKLLQDWNVEISRFIGLLEESDGDGIVEQFRAAGQFRGQLPERRKGMITSLFDIYVDVPDHPGIIAQITTLLGNERINLSNIQIIESREDVPGVLRLSFRNQEDADRAAELLNGPYAVHV
ncbi:prephenate dehydrogenase [Paenibacillus sp. GCM10023248]|uniref:prephenate dehydrogenase n=1 Tax=Bacillales TaxID=1385 RepID=UPI0023782CF7|nr:MULTISPECIES: prephenate dehydrogenase [Bacillales]MDD9267654.1 prephenate dehydrogenase [Paenibacillus sp. MAHUQ-63]MDR6884466.1 prephenate dehydrogenase [Bacillus sp. 3255]